ncbi:carbohydrate-binding module family 1 protein [Bipolaris oryzae ATCC 44560]|uniref:AA9 family lytic polysaccharide monooxygenase n=1 Tax=Bipolaris oryzae ATCC 44560 TaxID=930090 RepID=W6Z6C9_COCMI|nr:carbohydrate-binding module family 1 protein [Bipolaris oryzae ATCC 44560]EUC45358.1 carbohydrate-binding module family 1 protein [Bipolaris oryzae ATCC 44560]
MKTVATIAALAAMANAHATFQQLWKNGKDLESTCARLPSTNSPIEDYTSKALQCNVNPAAAKGKCAFAAGDTVTIEMHQQFSSRDCKTEAIGGAHWGPVLAYLSKVEDAATADGSSEFFKIYENTWAKNPAASQGDNDFWGTKDLNYNCGKLDFTIPKDLAAGDYLLRAEAIALHAAGPAGGAQHYVTCYQLTVTGSGTLAPKGVTFPEAYSKTGPGLGFSIHANLDSYPAPGPKLIAGGTKATPSLLTFGTLSGAPAPEADSPADETPVASASSAAASTPAASSAPAATPSSPTEDAEPSEYYQCGGMNYRGATQCAEGLECKQWNPYYFQCIKSSSSNGSQPPPYNNAPSTGAPSNNAPSTGAPSTGAPTEGSPESGAPDYDAPSDNTPSDNTPSTGAPSDNAPSTGAPSNGAPSNNGPSNNTPAPKPEPTNVNPEAAPSAAPAAGAGEKKYTLETFIAFLEEEAGAEKAAKIRRMIEALL